MNFGPRKMQISIAAIPAISDLPPIRSASLEGLGDRLEAGRARALDEDGVARLELGREQLGRLLGRADQLVGVVLARGLGDPDQGVDARGAGVLADLAVVGGGASSPSSPISPSTAIRRPPSKVARWSSAARIDSGLAL